MGFQDGRVFTCSRQLGWNVLHNVPLFIFRFMASENNLVGALTKHGRLFCHILLTSDTFGYIRISIGLGSEIMCVIIKVFLALTQPGLRHGSCTVQRILLFNINSMKIYNSSYNSVISTSFHFLVNPCLTLTFYPLMFV